MTDDVGHSVARRAAERSAFERVGRSAGVTSPSSRLGTRPHAPAPPRTRVRRARRRSSFGCGIRRRAEAEDLLPLSRRGRAGRRSLLGRRGGRAHRRHHPLLADPLGRGPGAALGPRRDRSEPAGDRYRSGTRLRNLGSGRGSRLEARLPRGRRELLSTVRLRPRARDRRHARGGSLASAVARSRRRRAPALRRGAPAGRWHAHRASAGPAHGSPRDLCKRPRRRASLAIEPRSRQRCRARGRSPRAG